VADWRQIRARIRRAKSGPDAATRLEQLFDKTRDGMVAFELALLEESSGRIERATDWYKRAWQRFRRSEWKQKAEEALVRHGVPIPAATEEDSPIQESESQSASAPVESSAETSVEMAAEPSAATDVEGAAEPADDHQPGGEAEIAAVSNAESEKIVAAGSPEAPGAPARPRRRRHRGGRGRGRGKRSGERPAPVESPAPSAPAVSAVPEPEAVAAAPAPPHRPKEPERRAPAEHRPTRERLPAVHIYRRGEPALASEIKALEAKLRQLLASPPHPLGEVGELPANPGVYLVSDQDLTTMYYLEACGNMRSAMDQLVTGRRGRQGSVRAQLAKYLGISDSQASRYLKQHCVARWIDLEESDSNALGHFAQAVLRPELMEGSN
jgi:hypothetical protein